MTTEEGVPTIKKASGWVKVLQRRLAFVRDRLERDLDHNRGTSYDLSEVAALEWAIPVLEAELDWLRRQTPRLFWEPRGKDSIETCPVCGAVPSRWTRQRWLQLVEEAEQHGGPGQ